MGFQEEISLIEKAYFTGEWKAKKEVLKKRLTSCPIVLYGCGAYGETIFRNFLTEGLNIISFCDLNKRGVESKTKLDIISPQELVEKYSDTNIVLSIANPQIEESAFNYLMSLNIDKKRIFRFKDAYQFMQKSHVENIKMTWSEFQVHLPGYERVYNFFSDEESRNILLQVIKSYLFKTLFQYSESEIYYFPDRFCLNDQEIFIDGGLYTGDTSLQFVHQVNGKYLRIIGFEIDEKNLSIARQKLKEIPNLEIVSGGLWSCSKAAVAKLDMGASSHISQDIQGVLNEVRLISLDEYFQNISINSYPTFIKLSVEGAERETLLGAERIIRKTSPKLAVCVYHNPEDIYTIPELIKQMNPNYKFFLKHYTPYLWGTVLYAY